jgi:nicotinate-nucleotide adenylyltransferase
MQFKLERVLFIPAGDPPHKQGCVVTPARQRFMMTAMATDSNPFFHVSAIELERSGPSYSVDTVQALADYYGDDAELYFIVGADAVKDLDTWHEIDRLLDLCYFVAATRPGSVSEIDKVVQQFGAKGRERILRLANPELEISSTDIRERVKSDISIKYIVPENVEQYILKEKLYRQSACQPSK